MTHLEVVQYRFDFVMISTTVLEISRGILRCDIPVVCLNYMVR